MSGNVVTISAVNPTEVGKALGTIKKLLRLGKGLSALTPTELDDKAIDTAERIVTVLEPFAQDEVVIDAFNFILELFQKGTPKESLAKARSLLS